MEQYNRIADEMLTLDTFPQRYRLMDSEPEKQMELRRMMVDNYSVFYTIRADKVIVTDGNYSAPYLGHTDFGQNGENKIFVLPWLCDEKWITFHSNCQVLFISELLNHKSSIITK